MRIWRLNLCNLLHCKVDAATDHDGGDYDDGGMEGGGDGMILDIRLKTIIFDDFGPFLLYWTGSKDVQKGP